MNYISKKKLMKKVKIVDQIAIIYELKKLRKFFAYTEATSIVQQQMKINKKTQITKNK